LVALLLTLTVGCSDLPEKELAYRNGFKNIWDRTMTKTEQIRKAIDKHYSEGNIEAASNDYKDLAKYYASSRESVRRLENPEGYGNLQKLAMAYFAEGAAYYDSVGQIVGDSGGNYDAEQEKAIKAKEAEWNKSTERLIKELRIKKFKLK
jgi:hypothetical protein